MAVGGAIGGLISKINKNKDADQQQKQRFNYEFKKAQTKTVQATIFFESKFVKEVIKAFDDVLSIMAEQEKEINAFASQGDEYDEEEE